MLVRAGDAAFPGRAPAADLEGLKQLIDPELSQDEAIRRAVALFASTGAQTEGLYESIWPIIDTRSITALKADFAVGEIAEFASQGAPLVTWHVTLFEPRSIVGEGRRLVACFDRSGRVCGYHTERWSPEPWRGVEFEEWVEVRKQQAADWMDLAAERLQHTVRANNETPQRSRSATWTIEGLALGETRVQVRVNQTDDSFNLWKQVWTPNPAVHASHWRHLPKGYAFWLAILVAASLAFVLGASWNRAVLEPTSLLNGQASADAALKIALAVGLGLTLVLSLTQALVMSAPGMLHRMIAMGFAVVAVAFGLLMVVVGRKRLEREPSNVGRKLRILLVAAVPLAYVISYFGCSAANFEGCCHTCTLIRYTAVPLGVMSLILGLRDRKFYPFALLLCSFSLVPHCICANAINKPWIDWFGGSPMCCFFGYSTALAAVAGLNGVVPRLCAALAFGSGILVLAFGIAHQVFRFPL